MSDNNLPVVRNESTPVRADVDSWVEVLAPVVQLAEKIYDTEFVPRGLRGSAPATAAAMLYGREVGLPPMTALNMTHVIEGKPGIEAEGMRALVYAAGHDLEYVETTGAQCIMRGRRRGSENWTTLAWTIDMARAAGLLGKSNWKSYPRAMLQARCTTELCRMIFPDVIHGFRSVEELDDLDAEGPADGFTAPSGRQTVSRAKKGPAKKAAAALPAAPTQRPATVVGPPLPGEEGYTDAAAPETGPGAAAPEPVAVPEGQGEGPDDTATDRGPRLSTRGQHRMIFGLLGNLDVDDDREERLLIASKIAGRPIESFNAMTHVNATHVIETLGRIKSKVELSALLDEIDAAEAENQDAES